MSRRKGETFPSDHRRFVRLHEDCLDDPRLMAVDADVFRFYVRLLLMTNRAKSKTGEIRLDRYALMACAMRQQTRHALAIARTGADAGLYELIDEGVSILIRLPNWLEDQGKPPADPRPDPANAPPPVPVPIPVPFPVPVEERAAPPSKPSARGIGAAEAREAEAKRQVELALERTGIEKGTKRDECLVRLEVLRDMFLTAGRVADAAQLEGYLRATAIVSTRFLRAAVDRAVRESETSFAPPVAAIVAAGRKIESETKRRLREVEQQSRASAAGGEA